MDMTKCPNCGGSLRLTTNPGSDKTRQCASCGRSMSEKDVAEKCGDMCIRESHQHRMGMGS